MPSEKNARQVLLGVGLLCFLAALLYLVSGRAQSWSNVIFILFFGIIFVGEYLRQTFF